MPQNKGILSDNVPGELKVLAVKHGYDIVQSSSKPHFVARAPKQWVSDSHFVEGEIQIEANTVEEFEVKLREVCV